VLTARQIAESVRAGALSPQEVLKQHLDRIDAFDQRIDAWVLVDRDGATASAAKLEAAGAVDGPEALEGLAGVPVGVKDIYDVAGLPTRCGSSAFAEYTPDEDAAAVQRLRAAGAVLLGKTATTEFAFLDPAPTRNPWNPEHTPGGSSSGSAAAVAAGMAPVALGSQTVGSVLRPAAYCGVVGLKPSHGRVSLRGIFPLAPSFDHPGIFSHTVLDAALVLQVIAGYDERDPLSLRVPTDDYIAAAQDSGAAPVVGVPWRFFRERAGAEVVAETERVAGLLRDAGATIMDIELPYTAQGIRDMGESVFAAEAASVHDRLYAEHADEYRPLLRAHLARGQTIRAVDYIEAMAARARFRREFTTALERIDVLLIPTAPTTAPAGLASTGDAVFCAPASFAGLPAVALPSGVSADGLPLSVQLVAGPLQEANLLRAAAWVERILDFRAEPPLEPV
jgi:Asp-tRNA(Asn)/Glu-tRNA(Gln) amidotransferase A subunit family amidase